LILTPQVTRDAGRMIVQNDRISSVDQPKPTARQTVSELDVLPGRSAKPDVVELRQKTRAIQRDVRPVKKIERHVHRVRDQREAELSTLFVQELAKSRQTQSRVPLNSSKHRQIAHVAVSGAR